MSNLGIWRAPPSDQTPEIWQQPWRSWNGAPCAGVASLTLGCTGSSQREMARSRELGKEKTHVRLNEIIPNDSFLSRSCAHLWYYDSLKVRLLTILQKFQFVIQILPINRDQSHDHIAVTCQIITQMNKVRQIISPKIISQGACAYKLNVLFCNKTTMLFNNS